MPFVIMTGMHGAFVPYLMQMLTVDPLYEPIFFPALIISNIDQGIAALAVALKAKAHQPEVHRLLHRCHRCCGRCCRACHVRHQPEVQDPHVRRHDRFCPSARYAVAGLLKTAIYAFAGASSVIALPLFVSADKPNNLLFMVISVLVGAVAAFAATWVLYKPEAANK